MGEISPKEYRAQVDALIDNSEAIKNLESEIADMDKRRERYNFYVKVSERKIDMKKFIENYFDQATVRDNSIEVKYM
ncbi:hypothetical protein [Aminipila sp.]|uniref:hypothetical protein n=1 Tax=Aminipila sp. TaxID=2060095 RepID=UPI0028982D09|nr:hypothetical protein [Aminipila sp.]